MPAVAGSRSRGRGRGRVNPPGRGMLNPPGQNTPRVTPGRGNGGVAAGGSPIGIGNAALPGPGGAQLERRVQSGKITAAQARQTMKQRQTLKAAFGPDWRDKLAVGGKSFAQVRQGLGTNPGNAKLAALNKRLLTNRKAALEAARKKLAVGGEGQE